MRKALTAAALPATALMLAAAPASASIIEYDVTDFNAGSGGSCTHGLWTNTRNSGCERYFSFQDGSVFSIDTDNGTGTFTEQTTQLIGTVEGNMVDLEVADFNGDGLIDIYFCGTANFGAICLTCSNLQHARTTSCNDANFCGANFCATATATSGRGHHQHSFADGRGFGTCQEGPQKGRIICLFFTSYTECSSRRHCRLDSRARATKLY